MSSGSSWGPSKGDEGGTTQPYEPARRVLPHHLDEAHCHQSVHHLADGGLLYIELPGQVYLPKLPITEMGVSGPEVLQLGPASNGEPVLRSSPLSITGSER